MEKKIEQYSLTLIGRLPQICKPNEFMVAYFIINTMSLKKSDRIKIYRGQLADQCNMSERNISKITEQLNNIGIIQKELIGDAEKKKTFNYYRLNWQFIDEFFAQFDNEECTFLPKCSGLKNKRIEEIKEKEELKEIKELKKEKKQFKIICKNEKIEENTEETYEDKELEKEVDKAIEQNLIPMKRKKVEERKQFVQVCTVPSLERKEVPDEETTSEYLKRVGIYA